MQKQKMPEREVFSINFLKIVKVLIVIVIAWAVIELDDEPIDYRTTHFSEIPWTIYHRVQRIIRKLHTLLLASSEATKKFNKVLKKFDLRRNYASKSAGARVVYKSDGINHANAVLDDGAGVLIFPCALAAAGPISVIIDLSEDFYMEELLLVSKSLFAGQIKDFRVESALDYPAEQWIDLGFFQNSGKDLFSLHDFKDSRLTRFVRFSIYSVHRDDNTYFCAINQIRVVGKTLSYLAKKRNEKIIKTEYKLTENAQEAKENRESKASASLNDLFTSARDEKNSSAEPVLQTECAALSIKEIFGHLQGHFTKKYEPLDPYLELPTFFANNMAQILQRVMVLEASFEQRVKREAKEASLLSCPASEPARNNSSDQFAGLAKKIDELERKFQQISLQAETSKLSETPEKAGKKINKLTKKLKRELKKEIRNENAGLQQIINELQERLKNVPSKQSWLSWLALFAANLVATILVVFMMAKRR